MVDINNPFQLLYLLSLIIHFLEIKASTNTVHIVHNEDDFENQTDVNLKSPLMGNQLEVKGKAVSTGTSTQTNCDIPAPVPAVPIGVSGGGHRSNAKLGPVSLAPSQSSAGKASHVTSASTGGNVPMPPPLPLGVASVETLERQNNQVSFNTEDFDQEGKKYPPGGKFVEEPEEFKEHKTEKDKDDKDTKVYENYKEDLKMPNGYLDHIQTLSNEEWCLRFIQLGGFEFLFNLFMSENGFISKKFCNIESMTLEEKHCADAILNILSVIISSAQAANEATLMPSVEIIKETKAARQNDLPKVEEDQEMDDVNDDYEIDEAKLLQNVKEMQPTRVRTISAIAREEDHKEMQNMKKRLHESLDGNCSSLLKVLTGEYGDKILNEFPFENFINRVMTMMAYVLAKRSVTKEDKVILQKVGTLTSILFLFNEDLLEHFYNFYDSTTKIGLKELIIKGLTFSTDAEVKAVFSNLINFICTKIKQTNRVRLPIIVVLEILKQHFFESIKDATRFYGYKEFYEGFCHLIHLYFKIQDERNKKFENILEPEIFLKQIINILKNYKTKEKRNTVLEDHCLIGIFGILEQILSDKPEFLESIALDHGLLHEIFFDCLFQEAVDAPQIDVTPSFDLNSTELHTNKCKTKESRAKAFVILNLLCKNSSKVREKVYNDCLLKMVSCIQRPEAFAHQPEGESRSMYSYSGLKNLGATCYMNSMLQQLYMIPAFKYLLLSVDDGKDEDLNSVDDDKSVYHNKMIDDNLLHQFQNTMGYLELSERPYYNAIGLCFSMKDYSGNPTNCSLQQDSHEFVNLSFDRLEQLLKPTPQKYIISDTFSAKQCTHMTCSNCQSVRQRIEDYYILSVPVKNLNNLEDSFNAYTDGEVISDFRCENCDQKADMTKRCSFVDMPNILMIHLQKIIFSLDTLMNEKIADRYEFPTYLNMENYTVNNIAKKYGINDPDLDKYADNENKNFEYRLVGVIIHQGVAEAGHYYSLICTDSKLQDKDPGKWTTTENLKWTEFNDTTIKDFNFRSNFEDECFGKSSSDVYGPSMMGGDNFGWGTGAGGSSKSAYVLIYEKREYKDVRLCLDINQAKKFGKTPEEIEEEAKEERRRYLKSIYSQYESKSSTATNGSTLADQSNDNMDATDNVDLESFKSSLECGNIAVPRDIFPYLVIPHSISVYLTQTERDKLKYIPVHYNREDDECYIQAKFKEIQKFIPYKIFKKVWDDNNTFASERQINNSDFFQFFKNTFKQENIIEQQDNQEKLSLLYQLSVKMIFDMLVYAFHNESIMEVSEVFRKILLLSDEAIFKFADYILEDSSSEFIRILMKCSESNVRDSVSKILSTAANRMFSKVELIEKAEQFTNNMINGVHTQASANWTKFEHFFNLINQIAIGGDAQLEFMKKNQIETLLADFFLAERSPIRPANEKRMTMGNNYSKPQYDSLVHTICYLSRHTDPRDPESMSEQDVPPTAIGSKLYPAGENEKKVIVCKQFATKAIKEGFEAEEVGKLLAHWSYQNEENSLIFGKVFLAGINETDYEEVAPFLNAMHHFLSLQDGLQKKRLEWLLGTPMLIDGSMMKANPTEKPKLGIYACQTLSDEVYYFPSTIEQIETTNESILSLIWRSKKRFESYTMFCIKELLSLGDGIMKYVCSMPSPSYQYARYTDWIFQFCEDKKNSKSKDMDMYKDVIIVVQNMLDKYEQDSKGYEAELKETHKNIYQLTEEEVEYKTYEDDMETDQDPQEAQEQEEDQNKENIRNILDQDDKETDLPPKEYKAFPRPYIIGKVHGEVETCVKSTENLRVVLAEVECDWAWNRPLGKKQTTKEFFDYYLHRKTDVKLWSKPVTKQNIFNKDAVNENFVNLGHSMFNKSRDEEEAMEQDEPTNLKPICEDGEGDEEPDYDSGWPTDPKPQRENDEAINNELNDREEAPKFEHGFDPNLYLKIEFDSQTVEIEGKTYVLEEGWVDYDENGKRRLSPLGYQEWMRRQNSDNQGFKLSLNQCSDDKVHQENFQDEPQEQPNPQQDNQESEIQPKDDIFERGYVVLRLSVYNFYKKKINIKIDIQCKGDAPNFFVPLCSIKSEIPANRSKSIAYFHKIHPTKPFGEYSFTYKTDAEVEAPEPQAKEDQGAQGGVSFNEEVKVWPAQEDQFDGFQDEISCEVCTLFNPISNHKCSICNAPLPHRK